MDGVAVPVRLVADAMLGRLARWLRALGYDTVYDVRLDDAALARLARADNRWALTRDHQLATRRGLHAVLIESDEIEAQLRQVMSVLPPPTGAAFGRCPACNGALDEIDRRSTEGRVPEFIWENQVEFRLCRACGRVYWRGSHYERMRERISRSAAAHPGAKANRAE